MARTLHAALLLVMLALLCNLLVNIGVVVAGSSHAIHLMYAFFNLLLGTLVGMWTTMGCGYKGMATNKPKLMRRYLWVWQHGQSGPLAVPQLGSCASSGRAWWLWAAFTLRGRSRPIGRPDTASGA